MNEPKNTMAIFFNDHQDGNRPHWRAKITLDGKNYEAGLWPAKSGTPGVFSGMVRDEWKPDNSSRYPSREEPIIAPPPETDDGIPF